MDCVNVNGTSFVDCICPETNNAGLARRAEPGDDSNCEEAKGTVGVRWGKRVKIRFGLPFLFFWWCFWICAGEGERCIETVVPYSTRPNTVDSDSFTIKSAVRCKGRRVL